MSDIIVPRKIYFGAYIALIVLTFTTAGLAFINMGRLNAVVAIAIAICKAVLVLLYFMHIRYSPRLMMIVFLVGIFWLGILVVLTMGDYLTRIWLIYPSRIRF